MKAYWRGMVTCLALLLIVTLLPSASIVQAQGAALRPTQPSVEAGATIRFIGENFELGERIGWWATDPAQGVVGGDDVGASRNDGSFEIDFDVPDDALGGRWAMTAYGKSSDILVVTTFDVLGREPGPEEFQAKVAPPSGPAGTTFAFAATGFDDEETISYWITEPGGTVFVAFPEGAEADQDGRLDVEWTVPADAPRGAWIMTMQGYDSSVARGVRFEVF